MMAVQDMTNKAPKPLSHIYYEEVEALKGKGLSNADAVRQVAARHGKKENAVRGGINQYKRIHLNGGSSGASRRSQRTTTVEDYVESARRSLEEALNLIDNEVDDAKAGLDAAQARYDEVVASVKDRKKDIEDKLKALS
jgi:phage gpG-like protein